MTTGDIVRAFEMPATKLPFAYPIHFVTPPGRRTERRERFKGTRPRGSRR
jgi:hypothetical protein